MVLFTSEYKQLEVNEPREERAGKSVRKSFAVFPSLCGRVYVFVYKLTRCYQKRAEVTCEVKHG